MIAASALRPVQTAPKSIWRGAKCCHLRLRLDHKSTPNAPIDDPGIFPANSWPVQQPFAFIDKFLSLQSKWGAELIADAILSLWSTLT